MSLRQSIEEGPAGLHDSWGYLLRRWREELVQIAREFRVWVAQDRSPLPVVIFDETSVRVRVGEAEINLARGEFAQASDLAAALSRALGSNVKPRDIVLEFPQSLLLRARLQWPKTRPWTLRQALRYELARLSPVDPDTLYFDFNVGEANASSRLCDVDLRIIKRDVVDDAVGICASAGLRVGVIGFAEDTRPSDWLSLPVDRWAFARLLWSRWNIAILGGGAILLGIFLLVAAYAREASWSDAVANALDTERNRAAVVERLERKTRIANSVANFVTRAKQQPMFVGLIADISKILPDDTWITELTLSGNRAKLEGYSHSASDLIAVFDRSPRFANAEFTAPLTKDEQTKVERFDLSFDVKPR